MQEDGVQQDMSLATLLALPECTTIFGEDLVFDLRALMTERFGSNIRGRLAHGLVDDDEFGSLDSYLWWIVLRLCCISVVARVQAMAASARAEQGTSAPAEDPPLENGGKNGGAGGDADREPSK
jgi:hypothetical protein